MLIALPSFAFAQTSGAGGAGAGNSNSSAGAPSNVHSSPNAPAATGMSDSGMTPYEGRSSSEQAPKNKVGDMPSSSETSKGNDSGNAH